MQQLECHHLLSHRSRLSKPSDKMTQPANYSAEDTEHASMERTSLVAADGDEEVRSEPTRAKWSRLSLEMILWSAVSVYVILHVLLPTESGHHYLLETLIEKAQTSVPYYGKQGQISSPYAQIRTQFVEKITNVYDKALPAFA